MQSRSQKLKSGTAQRKVWFERPTIVPETQEIEVNGEIVRFFVGHFNDGNGKVSMEQRSIDREHLVFSSSISSKTYGEAIVKTDSGRLQYNGRAVRVTKNDSFKKLA